MTNKERPSFLPEGAERVKGIEARKYNIIVAKLVAQAVKTTLGPKGMDKMLVDELGDITITNDGATILKEMNIPHPAGKMMVDVAKTLDDAVGDGTTTAVILAGELLKEAEKLLDENIHPTIIINGYRLAAKKANEILDKAGIKVNPLDKKVLREIAYTTMTGKSAEAREELADLVVDAMLQIVEISGNKRVVDTDNIKVEKKSGASLSDTKLINGIVIDKERVNSSMPREVKNANILLLDSALEIKEPETDAKIEITSPEQLESFIEKEEEMLKQMVEKIKKAGANVVFCQKGIDDLAQHFLSEEKIFAVRRVKRSDLEKMAKATNARIVSRLIDLKKTDLGYANNVYEKKVAGDAMVFVEGCKNPKAVTILVRGTTEHILDEAERAVIDALGTLAATIEDQKIVVGGGSIETELSLRLESYARTISGREQLAIQAFSNALQVVPKTLAESAGLDAIDTLVALKAKHKDKDGLYYGVDVLGARTGDIYKKRIIEPLRIKKQAISSASEVTEMILRIDDYIAASGSKPKGEFKPEDME